MNTDWHIQGIFFVLLYKSDGIICNSEEGIRL